MGAFQHHTRNGPDLRHDAGRDHVVYPAVVPVLRRALPDAEVRKGPAPEVLRREDAGGRGLRAAVVLENGLQLLVVQGLPGSARAVGGLHGRRRLQVDVDGVILCPGRRSGAQEHKQREKKTYGQSPYHGFGRFRTCPAALTRWAKARGAPSPLRSQSRQ